jgi:uncharacterized cupin superfamily protein
MSFSVLPAADAFWRPSNQMGVLNTDIAKQLGTRAFGARLWRLTPGQASTRHRHLEVSRAVPAGGRPGLSNSWAS